MNEMPRIKPEIIAAICAGIGMVLEGGSPHLSAADATITISAPGGCRTVRISRASNNWTIAGRQKLMDSRLYT